MWRSCFAFCVDGHYGDQSRSLSFKMHVRLFKRPDDELKLLSFLWRRWWLRRLELLFDSLSLFDLAGHEGDATHLSALWHLRWTWRFERLLVSWVSLITSNARLLPKSRRLGSRAYMGADYLTVCTLQLYDNCLIWCYIIVVLCLFPITLIVFCLTNLVMGAKDDLLFSNIL